MEKTEKLVVCCCGRPHVFKRPSPVVVKTLQVAPCSCGMPVTHIWYPPPEPSRWTMLEVD